MPSRWGIGSRTACRGIAPATSCAPQSRPRRHRIRRPMIPQSLSFRYATAPQVAGATFQNRAWLARVLAKVIERHRVGIAGQLGHRQSAGLSTRSLAQRSAPVRHSPSISVTSNPRSERQASRITGARLGIALHAPRSVGGATTSMPPAHVTQCKPARAQLARAIDGPK